MRDPIRSRTPGAIEALEDKLQVLEAKRDEATRVNAAWRKAGKPSAYDPAGWEKVAAILGDSVVGVNHYRALLASDCLNRAPFPPYVGQNLSQNIARIKARIAEETSIVDEVSSEKVVRVGQIGAVEVIESVEDNRLRLVFPGKPPERARTLLKQYGFKWSPTNGAWQRQLNGNARFAAEKVLACIASVPVEAVTV